MKGLAITAALAAMTAATPTGTIQKRAITPVTVKGNAFFAGNTRFYIRGVDYQPGGPSKPMDPIANTATCKRDIAKFKALGLNTIRVYTVDNSANHDECMNALADAGIYLALDVNSSLYSINRENPAKSYNAVYLQSVFATMEAFAKYPNTLLFFSANEVINDDKTTFTAPYVKAVTRDMKSYIKARGLRQIPVGYSAADVENNRYDMAAYMNCGDDTVRSDFYSFNDYSWCDESSFTQSGWNQKVAKFKDYNLPLFLSEYGCIKNTRTFGAVASLYGSDMSAVYSGGMVYQYSEESDNPGFGIVDVVSDTQVTERKDFSALMSAFKKTPIPTSDGGYKTGGSASTCPSKSTTWNVTLANDQLPALPKGAADLFKNGAGKAPGLTGGSQDAGDDQPTYAAATAGAVATGASQSKSAASSLKMGEFSYAPLVCGAVVLISSILGGSLIL